MDGHSTHHILALYPFHSSGHETTGRVSVQGRVLPVAASQHCLSLVKAEEISSALVAMG